MAGEGALGPTESLQGPAHEAGGPSEAGEGQPGQPGLPGQPGQYGQYGQYGQHEHLGDEQVGQPGSEGPGAEAEGSSEAPRSTEEATVEPAPMRQVAFMGVVLELPSTHPSLVLHEIDPPRRELRVTIAQPEGVAIAYAWRGMATPRPLTHDLLTTILQRFGLQVDAVRITAVDGPVFHAELAMSGPSGSHTVECRPSDALALALRQPLPVPIMVAEEVLAAAGRFPA